MREIRKIAAIFVDKVCFDCYNMIDFTRNS